MLCRLLRGMELDILNLPDYPTTFINKNLLEILVECRRRLPGFVANLFAPYHN